MGPMSLFIDFLKIFCYNISRERGKMRCNLTVLHFAVTGTRKIRTIFQRRGAHAYFTIFYNSLQFLILSPSVFYLLHRNVYCFIYTYLTYPNDSPLFIFFYSSSPPLLRFLTNYIRYSLPGALLYHYTIARFCAPMCWTAYSYIKSKTII